MDDSEKKTLNVKSAEDLKGKVVDAEITGDVNMFQLLAKASSKMQGWMKSAKALEIEGVGCVVQVTTQQGPNVAEALVFVPGVVIAEDVGGGRKLIKG